MANVRLAAAAQNAACDAVVDRIDIGGGAGTIKIYTGTQPANGDAALSGNTLLATLTFSATSFGASGAVTDGTSTAASITGDADADATGTATWARIEDSAGANVFDCDVGTSGTTIILDDVSIVALAQVNITSFDVLMAAA